MPIGRSPRVDVLLKAENVVLEFGGCVVRLAGLYISLVGCKLLGSQNIVFYLWSLPLCFYFIATLTNFTKQIEVHTITTWKSVLLIVVLITSWILYIMRSECHFISSYFCIYFPYFSYNFCLISLNYRSITSFSLVCWLLQEIHHNRKQIISI